MNRRGHRAEEKEIYTILRRVEDIAGQSEFMLRRYLSAGTSLHPRVREILESNVRQLVALSDRMKTLVDEIE